MIDVGTTALLWFSAVGCSLMAGLYFAFSTFVMRALERLGPASGIAAMNSINETIVRSSFMPLFWGTTLASAALAVLAILEWKDAASKATFAGGVIYVVGMFVCTIAFNVPLNDALTRVEPSSTSSSPIWPRYLQEWTRWNHVRTIACTISCVLFVYALIRSG